MIPIFFMEEKLMKTTNKLVKRTFWGTALFYFFIAFEFFYMSGPFAAYFYSAYGPILNFFNDIPILSWLNSFFLPHAVRETSSLIINIHEIVGAILAITGFLAFCLGACQIYYNKLKKKGVVTQGIYNYIRHPQYLSFMVCSLGLLLLWPRYIVAVMFITMIFAYYFLAQIEERECSEKFGQSYVDYKNSTHMFIPIPKKLFNKRYLFKSKEKKAIRIIITYILSLLIILGLAKGLETLSINSLYSVYTDHSVNISVCKLSNEKITDIIQIVETNHQVAAMLAEDTSNTQYLNYILPTEWFAAEIPMNGVTLRQGHYSPKNYDNNRFKVIITKVTTKNDKIVSPSNLLTNISIREPLLEVWLDLSNHQVTQILDMPDRLRYEGIPVAIY